MAKDSPTIKNKLSPLIKGQLPDFVQADHDKFAEFVMQFYAFLESAKMTYSSTTNYLYKSQKLKLTFYLKMVS